MKKLGFLRNSKVTFPQNIKKLFVLMISALFYTFSYAQNTDYNPIQVNEALQKALNETIGKKTIQQLNLLFSQIATGHIDEKIIQDDHKTLTIAVLNGLRGIKSFSNKTDGSVPHEKQLIQLYPITKNSYSVSVAILTKDDKSGTSFLKTIFRLIAEHENGNIKFAIPLKNMTKIWKTTTMGNIRYIYKDSIQLKRAQKFNTKNRIISKKLNVPTEGFKFYMCENYQEILPLLGYEYQLESATTTKLGYGVEEGYIFSIMNNEDFSHDIFHYYSGKINEDTNRNWIAEEGIACSWGNAYYTDKNGEMIELEQLVSVLKKHLSNTETDLLGLFENNTKIYDHIDSELSVRSVISGIICDEIENQKGIAGILSIINSGRTPNSMDAFFMVLNDLIGINRTNFNAKLYTFLERK